MIFFFSSSCRIYFCILLLLLPLMPLSFMQIKPIVSSHFEITILIKNSLDELKVMVLLAHSEPSGSGTVNGALSILAHSGSRTVNHEGSMDH